MKTYVIGDIHGAHNALMQCLGLAQFDYALDRLIVLGDVCDGYPDVRECIEELLKIKHCDFVIGNHDMWALDTGAGWSGKLTIMNIATEEYWQSDLSKDLYGGLPDKLSKKRFKKVQCAKYAL